MDEIDLRAVALAKVLDVSLEDVGKDYGDYNYIVNPHKIRRGPSPGEIQERADLLHRALQFLGMDVETRSGLVGLGQLAYTRAVDYMEHFMAHLESGLNGELAPAQLEGWNKLERFFRPFSCHASPGAWAYRAFSYLFGQYEETRAMRKIGLHDLLNTLYYLTENVNDEKNHDYALSLIEAFEGREVVDCREWVKTDDGEYLVVTDGEADTLWDEDLENYLDECILPEVPELSQRYFDREAWKKDARSDGRAHSLDRYDGDEESITVDTDVLAQFLHGDDWEAGMGDVELEQIFEDLACAAFADFDEPVTFYIYRQN